MVSKISPLVQLVVRLVTGLTRFDPCYTGNCLVNVMCIGLAKKNEIIRSWATHPGDLYLVVGASTGRDGIGGVTFASEELTEESETESRPAVQLGDPYIKEPLIHATLEVCEEDGFAVLRLGRSILIVETYGDPPPVGTVVRAHVPALTLSDSGI